jgi:hypothetical protein
MRSVFRAGLGVVLAVVVLFAPFGCGKNDPAAGNPDLKIPDITPSSRKEGGGKGQKFAKDSPFFKEKDKAGKDK